MTKFFGIACLCAALFSLPFIVLAEPDQAPEIVEVHPAAGGPNTHDFFELDTHDIPLQISRVECRSGLFVYDFNPAITVIGRHVAFGEGMDVAPYNGVNLAGLDLAYTGVSAAKSIKIYDASGAVVVDFNYHGLPYANRVSTYNNGSGWLQTPQIDANRYGDPDVNGNYDYATPGEETEVPTAVRLTSFTAIHPALGVRSHLGLILALVLAIVVIGTLMFLYRPQRP